jgi:NADPH-dependent curcumin reductase CurA
MISFVMDSEKWNVCWLVAVYRMIQILQVPKGEYVIQSAAASVFGRMFIQLAKHKGIKVGT